MSPQIALASCGDLDPAEQDDRPLVAALQAGGAEVQTLAWDAPGVDWGVFDLVLVRTTWDYVPRREEFCSWCEQVEAVTRLENPAKLIRWNTDKRYLAELGAAGLATIPSVEVARADEIVLPGNCPQAFLKPVIGAGANATLRFDRSTAGLIEAREHVTRCFSQGPFLLQPYLASVESKGEVSLIWIEDRWTHAVRKVPRPGDWRVQDNHGATDELYDPTPAERTLADRALAHVGSPLYLRIDLLDGPDGQPLIVELELVEPSLFFRHGAGAAEHLAQAVLRRAQKG